MEKIKLNFVMVLLFATVGFYGCTTVNPYTGQNQIDYGATAGVAGLALGAAALGVAVSNNNDNNRYRGPVYRPYRGHVHRPIYRGGYQGGYRGGRRR
jgi:hypothetical protein